MARSDSEHDGRDDRVLRSSGGQDALLQVDSVDSVTPEDLVTAGLEDASDAGGIAGAFHPSQGDMGLPRAPLRPQAHRLEPGPEGPREPTAWVGAPRPAPHHP